MYVRIIDWIRIRMFIVMNIAMNGVQNVFKSYTNFIW